MKRSTKIFLGIASIWPFLYIGLFMLSIFAWVFALMASMEGPSEPPTAFILSLAVIMPVHMVTIFGGIALQIYYIIHLIKSERIAQDQKVVWAVLLVLLSMWVLPIYWYFHIRTEPEPTVTPEASGQG